MKDQKPISNALQSPTPAVFPEKTKKTYGRNWKKWIIIGGIVLVILLTGTAYVLSQQKSQEPKMTTTAKPTISLQTPTPDPTADWKTYSNPLKGYTLKHPASWIIKDESDYLNTTQFSTSDNTVYIIISEGQYPYGTSVQKEISENDLSITVSDTTYAVKERIVNNSEAYVDFALNNSKNHHVYFGTGDLGGGGGKGLTEYYREKTNILKILSTLKFTEPKNDGKACGGIGGERGEFACSTGYKCVYPTPQMPDGQGACVKQ